MRSHGNGSLKGLKSHRFKVQLKISVERVTLLNPPGPTRTCLNPRQPAFIYAVIRWTCPGTLQDHSRLEPSSQPWEKHYTHLFTTVVTYLINKSHCQASDSSDTASLLFGRRLHHYPSSYLRYLFFEASLFPLSLPSHTILFLTSLTLPARRQSSLYLSCHCDSLS